MSKNEDAVPSKYPYSWSPDSDLPLQDFLMKVSYHHINGYSNCQGHVSLTIFSINSISLPWYKTMEQSLCVSKYVIMYIYGCRYILGSGFGYYGVPSLHKGIQGHKKPRKKLKSCVRIHHFICLKRIP